MKILKFILNDDPVSVAIHENETLLEVLRNRLGFTGTKQGCDQGECGACTVLVDGKSSLSCLLLAVRMEGRRVTTIEGLAQRGNIHPLQIAFHETGAIQCGFCTPGMILAAKALLDNNPSPNRQEIKEAMAGNLCRCTGYRKIIQAVEEASHILFGGNSDGRENL